MDCRLKCRKTKNITNDAANKPVMTDAIVSIFRFAINCSPRQKTNFFNDCRHHPTPDNCFSFPWWLCLGAIAFSILVSLSAGIYPAVRAAKVDPVIALRHD